MSYKKSCFVLVFMMFFMVPIPNVSASTKATPENCAAVGSAKVHCYNCDSSPKKYVGYVAVLTNYEVSGGEGYCVRASEAKERCSSKFGYDKNSVGFYTEFRIGGGSREETYHSSCVDAVGKP